MQAPCADTCGQTPYVSAPGYGPSFQGNPQDVATAPSAGCNCHGYEPGHYAGETCGNCGQVYSGYPYQGGVGEGYSPVVTDPYMSGEIIGGQAYPSTGGPVQSDNFDARARKFDTDGNQILWEEPLPPAAAAR